MLINEGKHALSPTQCLSFEALMWSICKASLLVRCAAIRDNCKELASKLYRFKYEQSFPWLCEYFHIRSPWGRLSTLPVQKRVVSNNWLIHCCGLGGWRPPWKRGNTMVSQGFYRADSHYSRDRYAQSFANRVSFSRIHDDDTYGLAWWLTT